MFIFSLIATLKIKYKYKYNKLFSFDKQIWYINHS